MAALRERIEEKVREMHEVGGAALREKFAEEAAAIGMTIDEIVQTGLSGAAGRPRTGRRPKPMAKMFRVYSVIQRPKQEDYWLNIGAAFPHEDGEGFNLLLQALPLHGNGKLVMRAYDGAAQAGPEEAPERKES